MFERISVEKLEQLNFQDICIGIFLRLNPNDVKLEVWLQKRKAKSFHGLWEFPGGKRELDEKLYQTLNREILEETGSNIENAYKIPFYDWNQLLPEIYLSLYAYLINGEYLDKRSCGQWVKIDELQEIADQSLKSNQGLYLALKDFALTIKDQQDFERIWVQ
jgi:8-oxo-dGTP pyrophosphatase MutT (NUDIX family)